MGQYTTANWWRSSLRPALAVLIVSLTWACDSRSPAVPSPTPGGPATDGSPSPAAGSTRYSLSGRVMDEAGAPIAGALVEVDHGRVAGSDATSVCPMWAFCWVSTETNGNGGYELSFIAGPLQDSGAIGHEFAPGPGYVYSFADGYETNVQWVPAGGSVLVQDIPLRRVRTIRAGQSTSLSVEPASSLCTDLEDWWLLGNRCEIIRVESAAGTLKVEVRGGSGPAAPVVFAATSGNYTNPYQRGPSMLTIPAGGGTYTIFVGLPEGAPSARFDVVTSLE